MRHVPNDDQASFAAFLDPMLRSAAAGFRPAPGWARFEHGAALEAQLEANGFFDAAAEPTLGPAMAAEMIARLAALPVAVECAASALLRPLIAPGLPRPVAVIDGPATEAVRFAPVARSVIRLGAETVEMAELPRGAVEEVESLFGYPMGRIDAGALDWRAAQADPGRAGAIWRAGVAAELAGVLQGGLDAVLAHVRERKQFGRPLGGFQSVQHRLAAAAVDVEAARLLALKAAQSGDPADAALALAHGQRHATRITYDLHQFMGAMGLTLEHPLHRFTCRARLLRSALGGPLKGFRAVADARWSAP